MYLLGFILVPLLCFASGFAQKCSPSINPPEHDSGCCGVATYNLKKIPGFNADLDQYPWMGIVEYKKGNETKLTCIASLISGRYALSAAQCFSTYAVRVGTPVNVRFGEYDIANDGIDCVDEAGFKNCNDGTITIPIEKIIVHPEYNDGRNDKKNDIALIKLKETAPYTDFIRPICLPTSDISLSPQPRLTVAGWSYTNQTGNWTNILHHVDVPFVDLDTCKSFYRYVRIASNLGDGQICAGAEGKDACHGDAGGPLMYENDKNTFEVAGIVSFGSTPCGMSDKPGIYTKVYAYIDWIRENITE